MNSLNTNKQDNLTFNNPFFNSSNSISLKYNSAQFNIDSGGNLFILNGVASQWTSSGSNIYYNTGNVGIGYIDTLYKLSVNGSLRLNTNTSGVTGFSMGGQSKFYIDGPGVIGGRSTILDNGNVGIGNSNPSNKLDVNGILSSSNYTYAGGLRIGGFDGNTLFNGNNNLGLTVNNGYSIIFISNGGNGNIMTINNNNILVYQTLSAPTLVISGGADFGTGYQTGTSFKYRMTAYFDQSVIISGYLACTMTSVNNSGTDYVGVVINTNQSYNTVLYIMYGSFTGIHRCFTTEELFNNDNPQLFKDIYIGRIVIASGKIATDIKIIKMT